MHCNIKRCLPDPAGVPSRSDCSYSSISDSGTARMMSRISSQAFCKTSQPTSYAAGVHEAGPSMNRQVYVLIFCAAHFQCRHNSTHAGQTTGFQQSKHGTFGTGCAAHKSFGMCGTGVLRSAAVLWLAPSFMIKGDRIEMFWRC